MKLFSGEWLKNKYIVAAVSVLLAIVAWSVVAINVNTVTTRTIDNVLIDIPEFGASYQALGLDIVNRKEEYTCSVTVSGERSVIGALTKDSFSVEPNFSSVTAAGQYSLVLKAEKVNQLEDYELKVVEPYSIELEFAEIESRKFNIDAEVTGVKVENGFIQQTPVCSPKTLTVIGESDDLDLICKVVAYAEMNESLQESKTVSGTIKMYDIDGNELDINEYRVSAEKAEITIPVYKLAEIPLTVGFVNVPTGFDISTLKYKLSVEKLSVAATADTLNNITEKKIGYIDFADIVPGVVFNFPIDVSSGIVNLDKVESVTVSVDLSQYSVRTIKVTDIRVENVPAGYTVKVNTKSIGGVSIVGKTGKVEKVSGSSVIAVVDGTEVVSGIGIYTVPVTIMIPKDDGMWAAGAYTVTVEVKKG